MLLSVRIYSSTNHIMKDTLPLVRQMHGICFITFARIGGINWWAQSESHINLVLHY